MRAAAAADRPLNLMLIDEDSVFRLSLRVWLERYDDFRVVAEVQTGEEALRLLPRVMPIAPEAVFNSPQPLAQPDSIDLVILEMDLGRSQPDRLQGLTLCQRIKARHPDLPVLMLSTASEPLLQAAAKQVGASGYCSKTIEPENLVNIIRRVATGRSFFGSNLPQAAAPQSLPSLPLGLPLSRLRSRLRQSGIEQIEAALAEVNAALLSLDLSLVDRAVLAGRQRELRVARKLVSWLLPTLPNVSDSPIVSPAVVASLPAFSSLVASVDSPTVADRSLQSLLINSIGAKLQTHLANATETPMEADILREAKKRELFYLILRKLEDLLNELRQSAIQPDQLELKRSLLLLDLWQAVTAEFFGKYSTVEIEGKPVELVGTVLQEAAIVQSAILDKIPGVLALFKHLLYQAPIVVDSAAYAAGNPEAVNRAQLLTENLLIQLANAVIQPLLNRFANVEEIKQTFYTQRLSTREIERFRNDLSWKYRVEKYFREPQDIFESQFPLYVFSWTGICKTAIYAPRNRELADLAGVQLAVTLLLETRDAIAPRVRSVISWAGKGVVYVLTEVVGRGLGLVGRGILKGLGNAWQDSRMRR